MATPSKYLNMLDMNLIRELIDLRKPLARKGLEWFDGARKRRDNQFKIEYEFLRGRVRCAPLTNPKAPTVPVILEDYDQYGVTPASIRIHHVIKDHDKIGLRKPGTEERWAKEFNEHVAKILFDKMVCTKEMLLWKALAGVIDYSSAQTKLAFNINFGVDPTHLPTLLTTARWNQTATATPLKNLNDWITLFESDSGILPNKLIMTRVTFNWLIQTTEFGSLFNTKEVLPFPGFESWLNSVSEKGTQLELYNGLYKDELGADKNMVNDGEVFLTNTDSSISYEEVASVENEPSEGNYLAGPWADVEAIKDPKGVKLMAGENMLPVVLDPNKVFKAIVFS